MPRIAYAPAAPEAPSLEQAQRLFEGVIARFTDLLVTVPDGGASAIGVWSVRDVAVHVSHVIGWDADMAAGRSVPGFTDFSEIAVHTNRLVAEDPERDLAALARRITSRAEEFLATTSELGPEGRARWNGFELPVGALLCHSLADVAVHGFDIGRAIRQPVTIRPAEANAMFAGFMVPFAHAAEVTELMDRERLPRGPLCIDIRLRRGTRMFFVVEDQKFRVEAPSQRAVDLHISAEPVALLLFLFERISRVAPLLRGRFLAWGPHPLRALRFMSQMRALMP